MVPVVEVLVRKRDSIRAQDSGPWKKRGLKV